MKEDEIESVILINFILDTREINLHISPEELQKRRATWKAPPLKYTRGVLYKYIKSVKSASEGCVTDE